MKNFLFLIFSLFLIPILGHTQSLSSGSISGSAQEQGQQQSGSGYLDYVSGQKRSQTKNQIFILDDFSGGLNSKENPITLSKNQGQVVQNVRLDTQLKAITKRSPTLLYGTTSSNPIIGLFRYYNFSGSKTLLASSLNQIYKGNDLNGVFTSIFNLPQPSNREQWLTWNNQAIMSDGFNAPVKYDGSSASATYLGSLLATDSGSGGGGVTGVYSYKVSCFTNNSAGAGPFELNLGVASNTITATGNPINLSMIPICEQTYLGEPVVGRYIYRTKAGGSDYFLLPNGTLDNVVTTLSDSNADISLSTTYPVIPNPIVSSPPMGKLSLIFQDRLWFANNPSFPSRVYYSEIGSQDVFLPTSYFDIRADDGDQVTMMQDVLGIMTIGKTNTVQKIYTPVITGVPAADWTISDPFSFVGCVSPYSAQNTPIGLLYLGNNGIYFFDGNFSTLLSDPVTPVINDIKNSNFINVWSAFYKNSYYLSYTSNSSGGSTNNRVLDFNLTNKSYSIDTSNINIFTVERGGNDIETLYGGDSNNGNVYVYTNQTKDIINKTQSDFSGTFNNAWYLPVAGGGDAENALIELANTATIDALIGTVDSLSGTIQENSLTGNYVSPPFDVGASSFDKIYWNETLPTSGSQVTLAVRSATSDASISAASWSQEYNNPSGSDISSNTAGNVIQYRISLTSDNYAFTPTLYSTNNYVVDLAYNIAQKTTETTIPLEWKSGWIDFGAPAYKKALKKIYVEYDSSSTGNMNINFTNYTGQQANFSINLSNNPSEYIEYFPNGMFIGELFNIDITESSLNALKIKRITIVYDIEPLV